MRQSMTKEKGSHLFQALKALSQAKKMNEDEWSLALSQKAQLMALTYYHQSQNGKAKGGLK